MNSIKAIPFEGPSTLPVILDSGLKIVAVGSLEGHKITHAEFVMLNVTTHHHNSINWGFILGFSLGTSMDEATLLQLGFNVNKVHFFFRLGINDVPQIIRVLFLGT